MSDTIDNIIFASYGNDSVALIQWAKENRLRNVTVAYSDTGWSDKAWRERVRKLGYWVAEQGFNTVTLHSKGLEKLVKERKGWPRQGMQFCTEELKIRPAMEWMAEVDPELEATCIVGVRRCESANRSQFPEWVEESPKHGGRSCWAPMVNLNDEQRDELLARAGVEPLPHRSMECFPCVNSNRADLLMLADNEERIAHIESIEAAMGVTSKGKPRTMFRPYRHMGAVGIREVIKWAKSPRGKYEKPEQDDCDSGWCGS